MPALFAACWTCSSGHYQKSLYQTNQESEIYLHTMLICSRAEDRLLAQQNLPSLEDVREHHRIEMADMRGCYTISRKRL